MQVTIDSTESLSDVLRVIGSMYSVTLVAAGEPDGEAVRYPSKRTGTGRGDGGRAAAKARGGKLDPKLVRQWAWENGHEVNARGSLPAAVRDAYLAANPA